MLLTFRAVGAGPVAVANAFGRLQVVHAVVRATRQAFVDLLVDDVASVALPASLAVALALYTGSVVRARGVFAVRFFASLSFPTSLASTGSSYALSVSGTVGDSTIAFWNVTFRTFPTLFAMA